MRKIVTDENSKGGDGEAGRQGDRETGRKEGGSRWGRGVAE